MAAASCVPRSWIWRTAIVLGVVVLFGLFHQRDAYLTPWMESTRPHHANTGQHSEPHTDGQIQTHIEHTQAPEIADHPTSTTHPSPTHAQMKDWTVPTDIDILVHGVHAVDGSKRKPAYELKPFPPSPMDKEPPSDGKQHPWLGAVICAAWDIKRRMMIRYTWMKMFKDTVPMDQRFVVSNPGPEWMAIVQQENRTFGDMIVLDHLEEVDFVANTVKTIEFFRWLVDKSPRKYEFVSKMDTDLFLNAHGLWTRHLKPRLSSSSGSGSGSDSLLHRTVNSTVIGQFFYDDWHRSVFPHGAIYTVTWDLVELLPSLQDTYNITAGEDVTMLWLLMSDHHKATLAVLSQAEKFEFDKRDQRSAKTAWARNGTDLTAVGHAIAGKDVIAIHSLKGDDDFLMVADCFDENGVKDMPAGLEEEPVKEGEEPGYGRPWVNGVPDEYWEVGHDDITLCNGVWMLEPGVNRSALTHQEHLVSLRQRS